MKKLIFDKLKDNYSAGEDLSISTALDYHGEEDNIIYGLTYHHCITRLIVDDFTIGYLIENDDDKEYFYMDESYYSDLMSFHEELIELYN